MTSSAYTLNLCSLSRHSTYCRTRARLHKKGFTYGVTNATVADPTTRDLKDFTKANRTLKPTTTLKYHSAIVNDLEYHHKFQWMLATVSDDRSLCIADLRTPASANPARRVPTAHADDLNSVAFNQGTDTLLATGSADKTVAMWDLRNLDQKLHVCESHKDAVTGLEWHPFERQVLASSSIDRRVIFWDLARCGEEQSPEDAEDGPPEL